MQEKTLVLKVGGMTCQGCVSNVTGAVKAVSGVRDADVSLKDKRAVIHFDAERTREDALKRAITEAGYSVS